MVEFINTCITWRKGVKMKWGSSQWCLVRESEQSIKTETQHVSSEDQKTYFNCEGGWLVARVAQRSGGVPRDVQKLLGNGPGQLALADPVLIGVEKCWVKSSSEVPFNSAFLWFFLLLPPGFLVARLEMSKHYCDISRFDFTSSFLLHQKSKCAECYLETIL